LAWSFPFAHSNLASGYPSPLRRCCFFLFPQWPLEMSLPFSGSELTLLNNSLPPTVCDRPSCSSFICDVPFWDWLVGVFTFFALHRRKGLHRFFLAIFLFDCSVSPLSDFYFSSSDFLSFFAAASSFARRPFPISNRLKTAPSPSFLIHPVVPSFFPLPESCCPHSSRVPSFPHTAPPQLCVANLPETPPLEIDLAFAFPNFAFCLPSFFLYSVALFFSLEFFPLSLVLIFSFP